ncbi:HNH endonuclease [Yersinia enterocolitica]|nr:HNH endonuclease [Yersinia enterocolitica]EKN6145210.1 HNH endonuclease [Yersinia enterocolitica]
MAKLTDKQELLAHPDDTYTGDCTIYAGYINKRGYGQKHICRKPVYAHRIAYCEANGVSLASIKELVVRHKCDNPSCVNPEHLIVGTVADNNLDRARRGRSSNHDRSGERNGMAKLKECDVICIRREYVRGSSDRGLKPLADKYGVSTTMIADIVKRKSWSNVSEV